MIQVTSGQVPHVYQEIKEPPSGQRAARGATWGEGRAVEAAAQKPEWGLARGGRKSGQGRPVSDAPSAIHSIVLPFHLTVFASWFCGDRQERAYPLPRALFATVSQILQRAGPDCPGPACPRPLQKPVLGSGRVSFP